MWRLVGSAPCHASCECLGLTLAAASLPLAVQDSSTSRLLTLPFLEPLEGTLDGWLLDQWCAAACS